MYKLVFPYLIRACIRKYLVPVALASVLGFVAACTSPQPTPTPTPEIKCDNYTSQTKCERGGQTVLLFKIEPVSQMASGNTAQIHIFITPEVLGSAGNEAVIHYSLGRSGVKEDERNVFAAVPVNKEIVLPFKPDRPNCFWFYINQLNLGGYRTKTKVATYNVGRVSRVSLEVDKREVTTYNPVKIRAEIEPSPVVYGWLQIVKDGDYKTYEIRHSPFELNWIPSEGPGVYRMYVNGKGGSDCDYIASETAPIEITVR